MSHVLCAALSGYAENQQHRDFRTRTPGAVSHAGLLMRRLQRKLIARILLVLVSIYLLPAVAIGESTLQSMEDCQTVVSAATNLTENTIVEPGQGCVQHQACISYCQITPLQQDNLSKIRAGQLLCLVLPDEPHDIVTRSLEGIERPPRV